MRARHFFFSSSCSGEKCEEVRKGQAEEEEKEKKIGSVAVGSNLFEQAEHRAPGTVDGVAAAEVVGSPSGQPRGQNVFPSGSSQKKKNSDDDQQQQSVGATRGRKRTRRSQPRIVLR